MIKNIKSLKQLISSNNNNNELVLNSQKLQNHYLGLNNVITECYIETKSKSNNQLFNNIPYTIKDNFCSQNVITTAGSQFLSNFIPNYSASVIEKLSNLGAIAIAKNSMDEFGMGGTGTYSFNGICKNPYDEKRIVGGSSSGGAISVATGTVPFAIGTDTGDSIRYPAHCVGVVGFKPSWGKISRWGLIPYAPSLDTVSIFSREVADAEIVFKALEGKDQKDLSLLEKNPKTFNKKVKIAVIKEINDSVKNKDHKKALETFIGKLKVNGYEVNYVDFPSDYLNSIKATYTILANSEAASCLANLTGTTFGKYENKDNWEESIFASRTNNFGNLVKRRLVLGSYFLHEDNQEKYYFKAKRIRRILNDYMKQLFDSYDILLTPCADGLTPTIDESHEKPIITSEVTNLAQDNMILANFYGSPSISLPVAIIDDLPMGLCFTADIFTDESFLQEMIKIESLTGLKGMYIDTDKQVKFH